MGTVQPTQSFHINYEEKHAILNYIYYELSEQYGNSVKRIASDLKLKCQDLYIFY